MSSIMEIMQLCRLCLVKDQVNFPIFEEQGDIRQIFLKITACLPVKVAKDDNLPKKICDGCLYKLELLYQFWNTAANAEKQLLTWLSQAGMDADAKTTHDAVAVAQQSQAHSHSVKQEVVEPCENENKNENSEDLSTEAQNYIIQQQQLPYESVGFPYEEENFNETQESNGGGDEAVSEEQEGPLPKRRRRQCAETVVEPEEAEEDDDDISQEMPVTKTEEESDTEEETRVEDGEPTNFVPIGGSGDNEQPGPSGMGKVASEAPSIENGNLLKRLLFGPSASTTLQEKCEEHTNIKQEPMDIECDTKAHLANSRQMEDSKNKGLSEWKHCRRTRRNKIPEDFKCDESDSKTDLLHCEICEKIFENNLALGLHTILHNNGEYSCHMCKYTNASKDDFEMHIRVHEGKAKYRCEICKKAFRVQAHAIEHKYFHTGEKPCSPLFKFDCPICFKHYTSASKLKRHNFMEHNAEVSPLCDICGKTLSSKEALKFHRRIHTGYKPHVCSMCPKAFTRKEQLREHERVHTGEKPYICKYCGKGFSQKTSLTIHERIHTGERPYVCRLCNKGFVSKGVMDTHMKSCDGGIPIK